HRQRRLRCDRRAPAPDTFPSRASEGSDDLKAAGLRPASERAGPGASLHHHPGGVQQRECDEAHCGGDRYEQRITHLPTKQSRQRRQPDQDRQPVSDGNAAEEYARSEDSADRGGVGALDEPLYVTVGANEPQKPATRNPTKVAVITTGPGLIIPTATATRKSRSPSQPYSWTTPCWRNGTMTRPLPKVRAPALRKNSRSLVTVEAVATGAMGATGARGAATINIVADGRRPTLP